MPTINQLHDEYELRLSLQDQLSKPVDDAGARLAAFIKQAQDAAKAVDGVGTSTTAAGQEAVKASASWERAARRHDDVSAAAQRVKAAEEELARTAALADKELAKGATTTEAVVRVLASLTTNLNAAKTALVEIRTATEASEQAMELWEANLQSGDEQLQMLAAGSQAAAAGMAKASAETLVYGRSLDQMRGSMSSIAERSQVYAKALDDLNIKAIALKLTPEQIAREWDKLNAAFAAGGKSADDTRAKYDQMFAENRRHAQAMKEYETEITQNLLQGAEVRAQALGKINAEHEKNKAAINGSADAQRSAEAASQKEAAAIASLNDQLSTLRSKHDAVFRVSKDYESQLNIINAGLKANLINEQQHAQMLDMVNAAFLKTTKAADAYAKSGGQAGFAVRQLGVQSVQFFSSLEAGTDIFTAFIQQGHQVVDVALATGTGWDVIAKAAKSAWGWLTSASGMVISGITAVSVAVGASVIAFESQARMLERLQNQLRATRSDYESMATTVDKAARNVAATSTAGTAEARQAGATIAGTAQFTGSRGDLEAAIRLSNDLAAVWGIKLPDAAKRVSLAFSDPAKAAADLAREHFPAMNAELARTIELLAAGGDTRNATALTLEALKKGSKDASENFTALEQATDRLSKAFTRTGTDGKSFVEILGMGISNAIAGALNAISALVEKLEELGRRAKTAAPGPATATQLYGNAGEGQLNPGQYGTYTDRSRDMQPALTFENVPSAGNEADTASFFVNYMKALNDTAVETKRVMAIVQEEWNKSPAGQAELFEQKVKALKEQLKLLGPETEYNAEQFKLLNASLETTSRSYDDNIRKAAEHRTELQKTLDTTNASTAANVEATAAIAAGGRDLVEVEARHKAIAQTLATGLKPGMEGYTNAVWDNTTANIANAKSIADRKAADDSLNLEYQINLIKAQTNALIHNTAEAKNNVAAIRNAEIDRKALMSGTDPDLVAKQSAQRKELADLQTQNTILTQAKQDADRSKQQKAGGAQERIDLYKSQRDAILAKPENLITAEDIDHLKTYKEGVIGAEAEIAKLGKTTAVHRDQLTKTGEKLESQTAAHRAMTAAMAQGDDAVLELTARMKAQADAINANIAPTAKNYNAIVEEGTKKHRDAARAIAEQKAMQEKLDTDQQIKLVKAETDSLGMNAKERDLMLQHMKDEYDIRKKLLGSLPEEKAAALAQKDALAAMTQELKDRQQTVSYLSGQFSSAFDTISTAMTNAFMQGEGKAVNWGNTMKSVLQQVIAMFAKLAIINPISNWLTGGNATTLSSVFNLLGSSGGGTTGMSGGVGVDNNALALSMASGGLFAGPLTAGSTYNNTMALSMASGGLFAGSMLAGGGSSSRGTGGGASGGGMSGMLGNASTLFSVGKALFPETFSFASLGKSLGISDLGKTLGISDLGDTLGLTEALSGVTDFLGTGIGTSGLAGMTIGGALSGATLGFGAGSLAGGLTQNLLGKTGPGPEIGAALGTAIGIGSVALAPFTFGGSLLLGGLVGGLAGGIGGGLIGPHPATPFSSTYVGADRGTGLLNLGPTVGQGIDLGAQEAQVRKDVDTVNATLARIGVRINTIAGVDSATKNLSTLAGDINAFQIGGGEGVGKFKDMATAFTALRFTSADPAIAENIRYRGFTSPEELEGVTTSFRDFINIMKGTTYSGATQDVINRVAGGGTANADVQAKLQEAATFFTVTLPGLLDKSKGSWYQALIQTAQQYDAAITKAHELGQAEDDLTKARADAMDKVTQAVIDEQQAINTQLVQRRRTAEAATRGDLRSIQAVNLEITDQAGVDAVKARGDALVAIYGDTYRDTEEFTRQIAFLDEALAAERVNIVKVNNEALLQLENQRFASLRTLQDQERTAIAGYTGVPGDLSRAQTEASFTNETASRNSLRTSLLNQGWRETDPEFTQSMDALNRTLWYNAQALTRSQTRGDEDRWFGRYNTTQSLNIRGASADAVRGSSYDRLVVSLRSFDLQADIERRSMLTSLRATWGEAYDQIAESNEQIAALETALASERLNIVEASKEALASQASSMVISLAEYARGLSFSDKSPLSPEAQLDAARSQFRAVSGAAAAGDFNSIQKFQAYAETYLQTGRAVYGSTQGYVDAFQEVTDGLAAISEQTAASITQTIETETRTQTEILAQGLFDLKEEVVRLNKLLTGQQYAPTRAAA